VNTEFHLLVEEKDILEAIAKKDIDKYYTKYPGILRVGSSDSRYPEDRALGQEKIYRRNDKG
jgi:hypothetical protein